MSPLRRSLALLLLLLTALVYCTPPSPETFERRAETLSSCSPPAGHSHNDQLRQPPLELALDSGFHSVETRVFHVNSAVRVCQVYTSCLGTFNELYLDPLSELTEYPPFFRIEVDLRVTSPLFKWQAITNTYNDIKASMAARPELQSWVEITFIGVNQNFPPPAGNPNYLKFRASSNYYLSSAGWPYSWDGTTSIPPEVESDIAARVATAHGAGKQIMFSSFSIEPSGNPEAVWDALHQADVDYVSTDDPPRYASWTASACPPPPEPDAGSDAGEINDASTVVDANAPELDASPDADAAP